MDLSLYLITDSNGFSDEEFFNRIDKALLSGVTMVQLREKELSAGEIYNKALRLKTLCGRYGVPLIINDRLDIALAAGADGVHLGEKDLPIKRAREILGADKIIGATAKTIAAASAAQAYGADYFGIGAFFGTDTKTDAKVMTAAEISSVTAAVNIPAVGIGGLNLENIDIISESGVQGAAVSNAIMRAADIEKTVKELKNKVSVLV